eukprot:768506-Hanusia_phi.AAC.5
MTHTVPVSTTLVRRGRAALQGFSLYAGYYGNTVLSRTRRDWPPRRSQLTAAECFAGRTRRIRAGGMRPSRGQLPGLPQS